MFFFYIFCLFFVIVVLPSGRHKLLQKYLTIRWSNVDALVHIDKRNVVPSSQIHFLPERCGVICTCAAEGFSAPAILQEPLTLMDVTSVQLFFDKTMERKSGEKLVVRD